MINRLYSAIKTNFLYGLILILPLVGTIWLVIFSIHLISGPLSALFQQTIPPTISFFLTLMLITLFGLLARNILGNALLKAFEKALERIPIVNIIYKSLKQVIGAFSFSNHKLLSAVLVEYPRKGVWALGFITNESARGLLDSDGKDHGEGKVSVFMPTTPNPTSGYFIYLPKEEVVKLDISVEESVKILMSAGVIAPGEKLK